MFAGIIKIAEPYYPGNEGVEQKRSSFPGVLGGAGAYGGFSAARRRMQMGAEQDLMRYSKRPFSSLSNLFYPKANQARMEGLISNIRSPLKMLRHPVYGKSARKLALMYTLGLGGLGLLGGSVLNKKMQKNNNLE